MVFCKLSKKTRDKLNTTENDLKKIKKDTQNKINASIRKKLDYIENKKKITSKKLLEKQDYIKNKIINPYKQSKNKNKAIMFVIDFCLIIVICLFVYKIYPYAKRFLNKGIKYTEEQYRYAMNLPESAYSREELRKATEFKKSFQEWENYYKADSAFSDYNVGRNEITKGNILRGPFTFLIQYVIPYVIVAYLVWFVIKYIKYVIAAMWGFFIALYQFTTRKITCTLAEKWYIRLITGWSTCSPRFSDHLNSWQNNYVYRPIAEQRINYLRNLQKYKTQLKLPSPFEYGQNIFRSLLDWFLNLKRTYIDLPLNELFLRIIDFHRDFVVKPYEILGDNLDTSSKKIQGTTYPSKTISGKVCVCPPKKTVVSKLNKYLKDTKKSAPKLKQSIKKNINNTLDKLSDTKDNLSDAFDSNSQAINRSLKPLAKCDTYDSVLEKKKDIAKTTWILLFLITATIVAYSIFYEYPVWLKNFLAPMYVFTSSVPKLYIQSMTIILGLIYILVFGLLGYYSFK